jgi:hypothetical protein
VPIRDLSVLDLVFVIEKPFIAYRADVLLVEYGYVVLIHIHILMEGTEVFNNVLIVHPFYHACPDEFPLFLRLMLKVKIGKGFRHV